MAVSSYAHTAKVLFPYVSFLQQLHRLLLFTCSFLFRKKLAKPQLQTECNENGQLPSVTLAWDEGWVPGELGTAYPVRRVKLRLSSGQLPPYRAVGQTPPHLTFQRKPEIGLLFMLATNAKFQELLCGPNTICLPAKASQIADSEPKATHRL